MPDAPLTKPAETVQPTNAPTNKVMAATAGSAFAGAVGVLINYLMGAGMGIQLPDPVQGAIMTIISTVATFAAAWAVPHGSGERVVQLTDGSVRSAGVVATTGSI